MDKEFAGRSVIVTGAASGLGRSVAVELSQRGADLALVDVNEGGLEETEALCAENGSKTIVIPTDLSDPDACLRPVAKAVEKFGRLDSLCNVAGMLVFGHAAETSVEQYDKLYAVNVRAPFLLFQQAFPHLEKTAGSVVNVASASGLTGHSYIAAYSSTKGALIALTRSLAVEYWKTPVRINAVAPGGMLTPMATGTTVTEDYDPQLLFIGSGPREIAQPEDVAQVVAFLASPRAKRVHGSVYSMDQGVTA